MKRYLIALHRWLGLIFAVFWLLQALSGAILVFHWELDDVTLPGVAQPLDTGSLDERLKELEKNYPGAAVTSIWVTAGTPGRYDVYLDQVSDGPSVVRVSGDGRILRARSAEAQIKDGAFFKNLVVFHQKLLAGKTGEWLVGISGILLLVNLGIGVRIAWARSGHWRRALVPLARGSVAARLHSWHRALGLVVSPLAIILVSFGVALSFYDGVEATIGVESVVPTRAVSPDGDSISPGEAIDIAINQFAGSTFSGLSMPGAESPWYSIRVLHPEEWRRAFGKSTVLVSVSGGEVLARYDATQAAFGQRLLESAFAVHTGEAGGTAGRILVVLVGCWLATMVVLGVLMWWRRTQAPS